MATVKLNSNITGLSGRVGDLIYRQVGHRTIVCQRPRPSSKPPSPAQQAAMARFRLAATYAKAVQADPRSRAVYAAVAKTRRKTVYALAMKDCLTAPVVTRLDLSHYHANVGDLVRISAVDDFAVAGVAVKLRDAEGVVVEEGEAWERGSGEWEYRVTVPVAPEAVVTIEAIARDRPDNTGSKSVVVARPV